MFSNSIKVVLSAMYLLFKSWRMMLLVVAAYAALLASIYFFVTTKESAISQLAVSVGLMVLAPALFFAVQAAGINYTSTANARSLVKKTAIDCWKLVLVSLPIIALMVIALYALSKAQRHFAVIPVNVPPGGAVQQPAAHKALTLLTTVRYALVWVVAPLLLIHLWIATSQGGLRSLFRSLGRVVRNTFAPESFLIYLLGSLLFLLVPYLILSKTVTVQRPWLEISVLALRLVFSAALILIGWVGTIGALSIFSKPTDPCLAQES